MMILSTSSLDRGRARGNFARHDDTLAGMERSGEAVKIFDKWLGPATLYKSSRDFSIGPIATASR